MPDSQDMHDPGRELREMTEKLQAERSSAVHLRIAAVEAQATADRIAQASVNKSLGERIDGVREGVDTLRQATADGFRDNRIGMVVLMIGVALTLVANLPGLWRTLKGLVP